MTDYSPAAMMAAATARTTEPEPSVDTNPFAGLPIMSKPETGDEFPMGTSLLICGSPKMGKSTAAMTARRPIAIDFENRMRDIEGDRISPLYLPHPSVRDNPKVKYPFNRTMYDAPKGKRFKFLLDWLSAVHTMFVAAGGTTYETLVFDSIDTMVDLLRQAFIFDFGVSKDARQDYKAVYSDLMPVLTKFTDRMPSDVIFVCHTDGANVDGVPTQWLTLPPYVKEWITYHVQAIGVMYTPATSRVNRIYWGTRPNWPSGKGLTRIPDETPANMEALYAAWRGEDPELFQPVVANPMAPAATGQAPQRKPAGKK